MIRLVLLPLGYAAYRAIRVLRTPFCDLLDHEVVLDADGLMCRRCGCVLSRRTNWDNT